MQRIPVSLGIQTSPSKDDSLFQNMNDVTVALTTGVQVTTLLRDTALCPLTKWLRWRLANATGGQITFRIWVTASQPGGFALQELLEDNAAYTGPEYVQARAGSSSL